MTLGDVPIVGDLLEAGADDRVFDWLLLAGPLLILFVAIAGRSSVTTGSALAYCVLFVSYVLYRGVQDSV